MIVTFDEYYKNYLGCVKNNNIYVESIYRDKPINKNYYYPLIKSLYHYKTIISVSPQIYCKTCKQQPVDALYSLSLRKLQTLYSEVVEKQFNRYSFCKDVIISETSAQVLREDHKEYFMQSGKNLDPVFKEKKWQELKKI